MALPKEEIKTIADIEALPEGTRAELIDGRLFLDTAPTVTHQAIVNFLVTEINIYIRSKGGKCRVFPSPFDVQLSADDIYNLVQPDISVICDRDKLSNGKRCIGAPDWVIEVVSPSTKAQDYIIKRGKYQAAGVREYWIVDPSKKRVSMCNFETPDYEDCNFNESAKVGIYPDLVINFAEMGHRGDHRRHGQFRHHLHQQRSGHHGNPLLCGAQAGCHPHPVGQGHPGFGLPELHLQVRQQQCGHREPQRRDHRRGHRLHLHYGFQRQSHGAGHRHREPLCFRFLGQRQQQRR